MFRVKLAAIASLMLLAPAAASAADMGPLLAKAPPVFEEFTGGWYLRGDIGMTNQRLGRQSNVVIGPTFQWLDEGGFDAGMLYGAGVGYKFNNWLRFDVTGEYRGKTGFDSLGTYPNGGDWNRVTFDKSEVVGLANVYVDLGSWCCVTPFVGVGIGVSHVMIDHFYDLGSNGGVPNGGYAEGASTTNFAWALYAGLAYKVTPGFTVELAYRYLDVGDGRTKDIYTLAGVSTVYNPTTLHDITSHDIKLGMRWQVGGCPDCAPQPLVRKY